MARRVILARFAIIAFTAMIGASTGFAQLQTGNIAGTVQDGTGAVIPGVQVSLSGAGVIGGNQQTLTDERGTYRFTKLVPSTYSVKVEMAGFRTVVHDGIGVNADVTVRVDAVLEVGQISDTVTVTGEAPLLDTTSALNQAVLDRQLLDRVPTGNDLWSIGRIVPGVNLSKYDVGGSESFQQSGMTIHGSAQSEKKFAIDGLEVNWPGGDGGSTSLYYDIGSFQEVNYQVSAISAENAQGGVVMNMVSKTGTNDFHWSFFFNGTRDSLQSNNLTDQSIIRDLRAGIPARALAANPNLVPRTQILGMFDSGTTFSGPIVKDKVWFSTSYKLNSLNQLFLAYNADGTQGVDDNRILNGMGKVSWQVTPGSQLHYTYNRNLKNRYHRRSQTFTEDRAAHLQDQIGWSSQAKFTTTLGSRFVLDVNAGYSQGDNPGRPQGSVRPGDLSQFDNGTQTLTVAAPTYTVNPSYRGAATASVGYFAGGHDLKTGFQWSRGMNRNITTSLTDLQAQFNNGAVQRVRIYSTPSDARIFLHDWALYLQDNWKVNRKLNLNLGLRLQASRGEVPEQTQAAGRFISRIEFPGVSEAPKWLDLAPRFGLIYDIFGNGRTAIKIAASRYHLTMGANYPARVNPVTVATNDIPWTDVNGDRIPQSNEFDPRQGTGFDFPVFNRYNPDIKRPYSNEYSIGFQHQLPLDTVFAATYFHRATRRNVGVVNEAVPQSAYFPVNVVEPSSGQAVTVFNLPANLLNARRFRIDNFEELDSFYNGLDLSFTKRMSRNFQLISGLTFGKHWGDTRAFGTTTATVDLNDPNNNINRRGNVGDDIPVSFKISGTYNLPLAISVSANFQHFTGTPELTQFRVTRTILPSLARTQQDVYFKYRGENRLPDNNIADLSVSRKFRLGENVSFDPHLDIFNLGNSGTIQSRVDVLGPTYQRISQILAPRMFKLGFKMNW